jgi:cytoskeletal protein RodZ
MSWSDLLKVLSGIFLAVVLIASGSFIAAQYVISQFTAPPPKPTFPNDSPPSKAKSIKAVQASASVTKPSSAPSPTPSAQASPKKTETTGTKGRVMLSQGVNLREDPDRDSERIGGIDYNEEVVVLEDSPDGEWQKVRVEGSGQEGWIKSGFIERTN